MQFPGLIQLGVEEKSWKPGILVLEVALLETNCFTPLSESKKESWNSRIPVLDVGFFKVHYF